MSSLSNLSWLLIGAGIGITLGEKETVIILLGMTALTAGFILHYIHEKKKRIARGKI